MISVEKARSLILDQIQRMGTERLDLLNSLGRVLAEPVLSRRDHPPWNCSAMDGYAVRHADVLEASEKKPVTLEVIEEIAAGVLPSKIVGRRQASRIMTGAPVPEGADAVIRVEDTRAGGDSVQIVCPAGAGENVRLRGEDFQAGHVMLDRDSVMGPAEVGLLASLGRSHLLVYQRPRVAILATGNELADFDEALSPNKIMNSNGYALAAQVLEAGGIPVMLGIAKDSREDLLSRLTQGLTADLILISGGVSVGMYDFVKEVLDRLGIRMEFWKVAMKPGEPLAFGSLQAKPVFGLPGNPVSTMVTFEQFVRPALRKMQGHTALFRPVIEAVLMERITKRPGKTHFVRAVVKEAGDRREVWTTGNQSSGVLTSMVKADGLLIFPSDATEMEKGQVVKVQLLDTSFQGQT
ncbi:MAG TPA: gephyrin-like molybdotransferase Glp, partial [Nitrospiria bacterium]|nr:gephyrin-like molybdotransferase Glp [Nitrospiria bacterium]